MIRFGLLGDSTLLQCPSLLCKEFNNMHADLEVIAASRVTG